jgi:hypothetical protein
LNRISGVTAHGASVFKHIVRTGIIAGWTPDGREKTAAIRAGFNIAANFITAIITKKTRGLFHFLC